MNAPPRAAEDCPSCGYRRPRGGWPADEYLGRLINDKYRITEQLGRGGQGVAVLARQVHGDDDLGPVVLKFLFPHLAQDPKLRRRFLNEARIARSLTTPNVVKVFDYDYDERGRPFIAMEYLEGRSLRELLQRGPVEPARVMRIGVQIAQALHGCHEAGIIHRDLKPNNVLLLRGQREDFVKLIDFGVAYLSDSTATSSMLGTPKYMPPEQILGEEIDGGVDTFSLGVLLFEAFAGAPPIPAKNPKAYLELNLSAAPRRLGDLRDGLPEALDALLDKMMAKPRAGRPASMADVEARLVAIGSAAGWLGVNPVVTSRLVVGAPPAAQSQIETADEVPRYKPATTLPPPSQPEATVSDPGLAPAFDEASTVEQEISATPGQPHETQDPHETELARPLPIDPAPRTRRSRWPWLGIALLLLASALLFVWASRVPTPTPLDGEGATDLRPDGAAARVEGGVPSVAAADHGSAAVPDAAASVDAPAVGARSTARPRATRRPRSRRRRPRRRPRPAPATKRAPTTKRAPAPRPDARAFRKVEGL